MAKKSNVILEDVELKPQIIGHTYKKKSNIGRTIIVIVILVLAVVYIDNVTLFINNLLGLQTSEEIKESANNNSNNLVNNDENKIEYKEFNNDTSINNNNLVFNNFKLNNNVLSFDINNNTNRTIDVTAKKLFLETYSSLENKSTVEAFKLDLKVINANSKVSLNVNTSKDFKVLAVIEKSINDYPDVSLNMNSLGIATLSCTKGYDRIDYTFNGTSLTSIKHNYSYNQVNNSNYQSELNNYKSLINRYQNISGVEATFTTSEYGFTALINIDLEKADLRNIDNKYYYGYKEAAKVVKYEMETYGFSCK